MQEGRQSIPYVGLEVATSEGYDGLEVAPDNGLEVAHLSEPENNHSVLEKDLSSQSRRKFGHSIRFWILTALGMAVLVAVIIIAVVETSVDHKHKG